MAIRKFTYHARMRPLEWEHQQMTTGHGIEDIALGHTVTFRKTVSECDVYLFAGVAGDFDPIHVDEEFAKATPYGRRVAHGVLIIGYMSAASSIATRAMTADSRLSATIGYGTFGPSSSGIR